MENQNPLARIVPMRKSEKVKGKSSENSPTPTHAQTTAFSSVFLDCVMAQLRDYVHVTGTQNLYFNLLFLARLLLNLCLIDVIEVIFGWNRKGISVFG